MTTLPSSDASVYALPVMSTYLTSGKQSSPCLASHADALVVPIEIRFELPDRWTNKKIRMPVVPASKIPINALVLIETSGATTLDHLVAQSPTARYRWP